MEIITKLAVHVSPRITEQDRLVLNLLLARVSRPGMIVAEVGSWLGNGSTKTMLERIKKVGGTLYCVDTWKGSKNVEWHLRLCQEYNPFETFFYNVKQAGGEDIVKPLVMESKDAGTIFKDGICDLIFVDADHSFKSVMEDINVWKSKVRPGGILCGHDCEGRISDFNPDLINANLDKDVLKIENYIFPEVHPGCIRAVDESFGGTAVLWAYHDLSEYGMPGRSTIWHVARASQR